MPRDIDGRIICPHNREVRCWTQTCDKCGWDPEVAKRRKIAIEEELGVREKKYKIAFTGYCEVYARSEEEALDKADAGDQFFAHYDYGDPECLEKE